MLRWNSFASLWGDARYALRMMRRTPGFTVVAVLSLALGIGANTAIFSLINTVMLRMLPVSQPERLVELLHRFPGEPHFNGFSWQSYRYFLDHNHVFEALIGTARAPNPRGSWFRLRTDGPEPEKWNGVYVTGNFFPVLGVRPALGRLIGPDDDRMDGPVPVAVVSWSFWNSRYNLDPAILGRQIVVEDVPVTIVGVAARDFAGCQVEARQDIWLPLAVQMIAQPGNNYSMSRGGDLALVGRLKPGVSIEQARAETAVLYRHTVEQDKSGGNRFLRVMQFELEPAGAGLSGVRDQFARPLLVLMALVGLLLLVACTNVASLLLARGAARQREMALRVSLGATRFRLVRQVLTESLLLSAAGALLGFLLAYFGAGALVRIMASGRDPVVLHVSPDARVLLFTMGAALTTGMLFGLAPALRVWRTAPASPLRDAGRASDSRLRRLFGKTLVVAQVAFSVVLLTAAGLFVGHLSSLYSSLGFQREGVLLMSLDPSHSGIRREQLAQPYQELLERLEQIPGVRSATLSGMTPISGAGANRDATVEGYQPGTGELRYLPMNWVAPKFFETYGTPLLAGRDFRFDDQGRPRVAIVNRAMSRHYFGAASPIGKHVLFDGDNQPYEIVGLVDDAKYRDAGEATPRTIYLNAFQEGRLFSQFSIRTSGAPAAVAGEVRRVVREVLKNIPVDRVTTLAAQVDASIVPERLIVTLSKLFGALGSVLAAIGLYGLLAYTVTRRINEIGVRMALGATQRDVTRTVLAEALWMVSAGLLIGVPMAFWVRRFAQGLIPDLRATMAASLGFGAAAMIAIALLAAWAPARRAARVDPMEALRHE
jgi:putative ABC transport system permease protein